MSSLPLVKSRTQTIVDQLREIGEGLNRRADMALFAEERLAHRELAKALYVASDLISDAEKAFKSRAPDGER